MKLSELIKQLQDQLNQHGDLPVAFYNQSTGGFGSFVSMRLRHDKGEFWGFMSDQDALEYLKSVQDDGNDGGPTRGNA